MSVWTTDLGQGAESDVWLKEQNLPSLNWFVLLITVSFLCLTVDIEENGEFWPSNREQMFYQESIDVAG